MSKILQLNCSKCGAEQACSPSQGSIVCEYCGSQTFVSEQVEEFSADCEADYIVPLSFEKTELTKITHSYMIEGDLTPDDMLDLSEIVSQQLYYLPAYIFSGDFTASWTASFGYDRIEHYTDYETETVYINGRHSGYRQVPVTKTKTVTDWRPVNGVDSGSFLVKVFAGSDIPPGPVKLIESSSVSNKLLAFSEKYLVGFEVRPFAISERSAYSEKGSAYIDAAIGSSVRMHAQGDHQKDWRWSSQVTKQSHTVLLPVAHSVFKYDGKTFNLWVDGSNGSRISGDPLPVDERKKLSSLYGFFPAGAVALVALLSLFFDGSIFVLNVLVFGCAIAYGYFRKKSIIKHSKAVRKNALSQKTVQSSSVDDYSGSSLDELLSSYQAPKIPLLANTAKDFYVLPGIAVALSFIILIPVFYGFISTVEPPEPVNVIAKKSTGNIQSEQRQVIATEQSIIDSEKTETNVNDFKYVLDSEGVLSRSDASELSKKLIDFEMETSHQIGVIFVKELSEADFNKIAAKVFQKMSVSDAENKISIIISIDNNNVQIILGEGFLGRISTARINQIKYSINPSVTSKNYSYAINMAVDQLIVDARKIRSYNMPKMSSDDILLAERLSSDLINNIEIKPSFDCSKASSLDETIVCSDSELAALDLQLASQYKKALSISSYPEKLREDQAYWVQSKRECKEKSCLLYNYQQRLDYFLNKKYL